MLLKLPSRKSWRLADNNNNNVNKYFNWARFPAVFLKTVELFIGQFSFYDLLRLRRDIKRRAREVGKLHE